MIKLLFFFLTLPLFIATGYTEDIIFHDANATDFILAIDTTTPTPTMTITNEGKVFINDVEIKKLSQPEIVEQLKLLVSGIQEGEKAWDNQCGKQTDYLLGELEKCQAQMMQLKELIREMAE